MSWRNAENANVVVVVIVVVDPVMTAQVIKVVIISFFSFKAATSFKTMKSNLIFIKRMLLRKVSNEQHGTC